MSTVTMNWALRQRLETAHQQGLLYVIADSADPGGVTRDHCTPEYMCEHARMTRATMFRRLGELETLGLLKRLKFYSPRGAPMYQIHLDLKVTIILPIKRRKGAEDAIDDHDESDAEEAGNNEEAESQAETLGESHAATMVETIVPCSASPQSQSCDYISPSLPKKDSPPYPPPGGAVSREEDKASEKREALWQRFVQGYPGIATMDQREARAELDELTLENAEWAVSVLPALKEELRKVHDRPPKNAHIWLRKGMFRNFPPGKPAAADPARVWIVEGSEEDRALQLVRGLTGALSPFVSTAENGSRGYYSLAKLGPDLLAMLDVADQSPVHWLAIARETPAWFSWQKRFKQWTGRPRSIVLGSDGAIRVPWPWPPSRQGVIYQVGDAHDEAEDSDEPPA